MSRWLKGLILILVFVGAGLLSLPWWLGAALRPVLRARGITFEHYARAGYAHFQLHGVRYANPSFELTAAQVESLTPTAWFWQRLRGAQPTLVVTDWRLRRIEGPAATGSKPTGGLPALRSALQSVAPRLAYWLPRAHLIAGHVQGFGPELKIATVDWRDTRLSVDGLHVADQVLAFVVAPAADGAVDLLAHTADNEAKLHLVWSGTVIRGEAALWEQPVQLSARFPDQGWLPAEASAAAENWRLPASRVKLGAPYAQVRGDARLIWRDGAFDLTLDAKAEPAADTKTKAPPFAAHAAAHGNLRELTLTALAVDAPFATAKLSAPVTFSLEQPRAAAPAQLNVQVDLAKVPWLDAAQGTAEGTVVVSGNTAAARQDFELKCSNLLVRDISLREVQARGALAWPELKLSELKVRLDETSALEASGAVNWQTRELAGVRVRAKFDSTWFARWLPAGASWTTAEVAATAEGPLDAPRHQGSLTLTGAQRPPLHPLAITASWQGTGAKTEITARAAAEKSVLELAGTLEPPGLQLTKLSFAPGGEPGWQLTSPAQLTWSPGWQIDHLQLAGADSRLIVNGRGGPDGSIELTAANFPSAWLQDWVTLAGPGWQVQSLQANGRVTGQVLVFDTTLTAQIEMSPQPARFSLVAHGDAHGIELKELKVLAGDLVLTQATGRLPLAFALEPEPHLSWDGAAPLELSASTEPESPLWAALASYTGLQLTKPTARVSLKGTLRQPTGELQVNVAQLGVTPGRFKFPVPDFDDLALAMRFDRESVAVTNFSAKVDGQAVAGSGQLPMDATRWQAWWRTPAAIDWSQAAAKVDIPEADLAPLARRFPGFVAAHGRLQAHVVLAPGKKISGELHLAGAATRPLGVLGAVQDIQADLTLADRAITVRSFTGNLGGEPVTLDGSITLGPDAAPRLALNLKGANLPLIRNTGLLLRTDVDLHAMTDGAGLTRLSGAFTVRDCLVLANINLRTLLPTGRRGVTRQPPWFAVLTEPYSHWPLAVDVRAPGTVRVRTTAYNGTASAHFQLGGTLGEPRAVGELSVDQGQVLFPFATFKVSQATVRLREADPYHAVVNLNAASQRRDYQLRLEMTGELPAPNVTITSTPALAAADVLLMVMTGQPPVADTPYATTGSGPRLALLGAYLSRGFFQNLGFSGEDRLEISAGEHISRTGRETYEFEYKLSERWSLQGEYDEFDAYNAGVKWRVYTQESTPVEKKK